ncbi:hypothetical protein F5887DRAFT_1085618 [Amanita rubescens]|nr:hypothetical protein F5887DRAFT_1085618 [Amanita rubescens]
MPSVGSTGPPNDAAVAPSSTPIMGNGEDGTEEHLPSQAPPTGSQPVTNHSAQIPQRVGEPNDAKEWKENKIFWCGSSDQLLEKTLKEAVEMGEKFDKKLLEEMRVLGMPIPRATDRPASGTNAVSNGESTSRVPRATDRPASRTNVVSNDDTTASHDVPPPNADTISVHNGTSAVTSANDQTTATTASHVPPPNADTTSVHNGTSAVTSANDQTTGAGGASAQRNQGEPWIVAIGLQNVSGEIEQVVVLLPLGHGPTVAKVLDCLRDEPQARALRARLSQMKSDAVEIRTAKKPLHTAQIAKFRGKWGDQSELLGKLADTQLMRQLVPCDNCQESEDIRAFVGSTIPRTTPILVVYMFELLSEEPSYANQIRRAGEGQDASSINNSGLGAASRLEPSFPVNVVLTKETARPQLTDEISKYLIAMKIEENLRVYEHHVLQQPGVGTVFSTIVFARLVEAACERIGIPYRDRVPVYQKNLVKHGAWMACVDQIVLFYGQKLASWGYNDSAPAPSTFENHRSLHMRALRCLRTAEKGKGKESLGEESEALLRSLKEILLTPLDRLDEVDAVFPSLYNFNGSVNKLLKALGGKAKE